MYRLISLTGPTKGQRITVDEEPMVLGRDADCAVVLDDVEVSRRHAVLEHRRDGLVIKDLGSMNRILVNKREVREAHLKHGDMVELGRTRFLVQAVVQAEVEPVAKGWMGPRARRSALWILAVMVLGAAGWWRLAAKREPGPASVAGTEPAATANVGIAPTQVTEQIRQMRQDLEIVTRSVRNIAKRQATPPPVAAATIPAIPAEAAPVEPAAPADEATRRNTDAFHAAQAAMASNRLDEADALLAALQAESPDFLPSYVLRARLYEQQGKLEKAIGQWSQVISRSADTPDYEQAYSARAKLAGQLARGAMPSNPMVKISSVTQRRFPKTEDYDEMRVFDIVLVPAGTGGILKDGNVRVEVWFFDEDVSNRSVSVTRAIVPRDPLIPRGVWVPGEEKSVTASYVVPRGFRFVSPAPDAGKQFHGYVIQVYAGDELQDEQARPATLLSPATEAVVAAGSDYDVLQGGSVEPSRLEVSQRPSQE